MADGSVIIDSKLDKSGLESGLASLGKFSSSAFGVIGKGIAAISGGLTAMGGFAVHAGMNFDTAMSQVAATMGKSVDEIQILSDKAKEMGESTKFSATEAAEALNYLALAGYDASTAADVLPSVLNLAAAGGMQLGYAADLATDAMSALGIAANEANLTKFGDELAMTASKANTNVSQLGEAILTVGGTAKVLKGGTVELNTALGVLANRGIKGAEGGTHLRNVILALTAPTEKSAEAMKKLGVSATTSTGEMRPLNEVLGDLDAAMSNLTDAQKTEVLNTIFNKTDIAAVQGLIAGLGEEWNSLAGNIENAGGAMQKMADTQIDNLEGDITILKSALEGLGIAAYEGARGPMRQIVQLGTQMITDLTNAMKKGGYKQLARALGDVISRALTQVTGYVPKVVDLAVDVIEGLCDGLIDNADGLTEGLSSAVVTAIEGISRILPKVAQAGITIAVSLAQSLANELPTLIPKVIDGLVQTIVVLCQNAGQILQAGVAIAKALVTGIISALPSLVGGVIDAIGGLWQSVTGWLKGKPATVLVDVDKEAAEKDIKGLTDTSETVSIDVILDGADAQLQSLQADINRAKNTYLKEAINIEVTYDKATPLIEELEQIQQKGGLAKEATKNVLSYKPTLATMGTSLTSIASGVKGMIDTGSIMFKQSTKDNWNACAESLSSIAKSANGLGDKLGGLADVDFKEPEGLKQTAGDAKDFADKLREGAEQLRGLAENTKDLNPDKASQLNTWAGELEKMAQNADALATELETLSGKEVLSAEDVQRMQEITQTLTEMYPQLAQYVGENGVLSLEAKEVQTLVDQYRQLALTKAASQYVADAEATLANLRLQQELLNQSIESLDQQNQELTETRDGWQTIADEAARAVDSLQQSDNPLLDAMQGVASKAPEMSDVANALQLVSQYLELTGKNTSDLQVDNLSLLVDELGNLKSAEEIFGNAEAIKALQQALAGMVGEAPGEIHELNTELDANSSAAEEAKNKCNELAPAIQEAQNAADQAHKVYDKVAESLNATAGAAGSAGSAVEESGKDIQEGGEAAKEGAENFAAANEEIQTTAESASEGAKDVGEAAKDVTEKAKTINDASTSLTTAQTKAEEAAAAVKKAQEGITTDAATALTNAQNTANSITLLAQQMLETVKGVFTEDAIAAFAEYGKQIIEQIATGMETAATISTFTAAGTAVYNAVKGALEAALGANGSKFNAIGKSIVTGVATGMSNAATKAAFSSAAGKVKNAAYNALSDEVGANGSNFKAIGKNICTGVAAGIDANSGSIASAARRAARAAYDAAMHEIDANSPSKLFRRTVGKYISQGMALGIEDGIPDIEGSVGKAIDSISGLDDLDLAFSAADQMRALAASRNTAVSDESYADNSTDINELAQAIWDNVPEDFAVNQTVNFNYPIQAPDEVARAIRDQNTYGLVGVRR